MTLQRASSIISRLVVGEPNLLISIGTSGDSLLLPADGGVVKLALSAGLSSPTDAIGTGEKIVGTVVGYEICGGAVTVALYSVLIAVLVPVDTILQLRVEALL